MSRTAPLSEVIQGLIDANLADVHTAMPCVVVSYDVAKQVADVQPLVKRTVVLDGEYAAEELPVLPAVPIAWPRGGGFFVHMPLAAGDAVLVVFSEQDPAQGLDRGDVAEPADLGRHTMAGAVAIPCSLTTPKRMSSDDAQTDRMSFGKEGGPRIEIDSEIRLGAATNPVALSNLVTAALNALKTAISTAAATEAGAGGTGGMTALNGGLGSWPPAVAAAKVKAE